MAGLSFQKLPDALKEMTQPFDWAGYIKSCKTDKPRQLMPSAYAWFHMDLDPSRAEGLIEQFLETRLDQDRVRFAEDYAASVLELTDLADAIYFRRGVWRKEAVPETVYPRQRDHAVHTVHNYLLGWYFFMHCPAVTAQFRQTFEDRRFKTDEDAFIKRFGELWCFASLLHDIGYILEGQLPAEGTALTDEGMRQGAQWASNYFTNVFWKLCGLKGVDERRDAEQLLDFSADPIDSGSLHSIALYLRDAGSSVLSNSIGLPLPNDAFALWEQNYHSFKNSDMAARMKELDTAFETFMEKGLPKADVRVIDHGVSGGLLLLKYSTLWFRLYRALSSAPKSDLKNKILAAIERDSGASHWWASVVWSTAAVAIHNVQQTKNWERKPLALAEDPLAYLGIIVDILQEWDRHAMVRTPKIDADLRGIDSRDVQIAKAPDGKIHIVFWYRDKKKDKRDEQLKTMKDELSAALKGWESLLHISFEPVKRPAS